MVFSPDVLESESEEQSAIGQVSTLEAYAVAFGTLALVLGVAWLALRGLEAVLAPPPMVVPLDRLDIDLDDLDLGFTAEVVYLEPMKGS